MTRDLLERVLERLRERVPELAVEWYPRSPSEYQLTHPIGALLVGFGGTERQTNALPGAPNQIRSLRIPITAVIRASVDSIEPVDWLDRCRSALLGYAPEGERRRALAFVGETFVSETTGTWIYEQEWQSQDLITADP